MRDMAVTDQDLAEIALVLRPAAQAERPALARPEAALDPAIGGGADGDAVQRDDVREHRGGDGFAIAIGVPDPRERPETRRDRRGVAREQAARIAGGHRHQLGRGRLGHRWAPFDSPDAPSRSKLQYAKCILHIVYSVA